MEVPVKFPFWFNSYLNSQTSVDVTADKMQNLLTKQELGGTYNTVLHELHKKNQLKYHMTGANRKTTFCEITVYPKANVCGNLEFIIHAFSSY